MTRFFGRILFETGMDLGRWELSVGIFFRLPCAYVMVGPLYAQVSW